MLLAQPPGNGVVGAGQRVEAGEERGGCEREEVRREEIVGDARRRVAGDPFRERSELAATEQRRAARADVEQPLDAVPLDGSGEPAPEVEGGVAVVAVQVQRHARRQRRLRLAVGEQQRALEATARERGVDGVERARFQRAAHQRLDPAAGDATEHDHEHRAVRHQRPLTGGAAAERAIRPFEASSIDRFSTSAASFDVVRSW